jgi:hypothetical protein
MIEIYKRSMQIELMHMQNVKNEKINLCLINKPHLNINSTNLKKINHC